MTKDSEQSSGFMDVAQGRSGLYLVILMPKSCVSTSEADLNLATYTPVNTFIAPSHG